MKVQYLGDSRDSFKWDYHDFLTSALEYPMLNVILMLTPDDNSSEGQTHPENYPARKCTIDFCHDLQEHRNLQLIQKLPFIAGSKYTVDLHKAETHLTRSNRREYFSDICREKQQVLFLDPDNGFEPEKSNNVKHVLYSDIDAILDEVSEETVISVFQYFRRIPFNSDFARIKQRLLSGSATAIYWHSLMFVAISRSKNIIDKVHDINQRYARQYPVQVLHD
ncbi:MAG: hypothetical protein OEL75_02325 [Kiritimatiellaceae bacterium]|nr:hypothetical protein [Kiritimatiellaceae bacterium]